MKFRTALTAFMIVSAIGLAGCKLTKEAGNAAAEKAEYNDRKRDLLTNAQCDTSVGAYHRSPSPRQKAALDCACGGPCVTESVLQSLKIQVEQ